MRVRLKLALALLIVVSIAAISAIAIGATSTASWNQRYGMIIQRVANQYLATTSTNNGTGTTRVIQAKELKALITNTDTAGNLKKSDDPLILDIRTKLKHDSTATIDGSVWIADFGNMAAPATLQALDSDLATHKSTTGNESIVIYCDTGHKAGLVASILGMLGYDVKNLFGGYDNGWKTLSGGG